MSSSDTRSSHTSAHVPSALGSNVSPPSMSARVSRIVAPVAFATRRRSSLGTRRHAMAPASTKYLSAMSSMPLEHRITFAPASRIIFTLLAVISSSSWRIRSSSFGSVTSTCTPICIFVFCRLKSTHATFAFFTLLTIPCAARPRLSA